MPLRPLTRLRRICVALPHATEQETWGEATFRVRRKIFVLAQEDGTSFWCKAPPGSQHVLVNADPKRFYVPPYVGHKGWVGVSLDGQPDWDEVARIVERSYELVAPQRLGAMRRTSAGRTLVRSSPRKRGPRAGFPLTRE